MESRKLSDREVQKVKEDFVKDKADIKVAIKGAKEVKSISYNKKDEEVSKKREIILPDGQRLKSYVGKKLKVTINLYWKGKNNIVKAGTKWDEIPMDIKLRYPFKSSQFE